MVGRRPIFASLVTSLYYWVRDSLYKATLEPESHEVRKAKESFKPSRDKKEAEKKPW